MHVSFIHILLPQFLTDSLVNILLFEVGYFCVHLGKLGAHVRDYCCNLWVGEGCWCLGNYGWLADIDVGIPNIPPHLLHCNGKIVQGSQTNL